MDYRSAGNDFAWPIRTSVMIKGDIAYFGAGLFPHENVYLYAVNASDGKIVWRHGNISQRDAGRNDLSPQGYLLCSDDKLFVPSGRSMPGVFKLEDGQPAYKGTVNWRKDGISGGTQALLADGQLYTYGAHQIMAMSESNGKVGFGWFNGDQMAIDGESAYVANGQVLASLDRKEYAVNSRERHKLELELADVKKKVRSAKGLAQQKMRLRLKEIDARLKEIEDVGFKWKVDSDHESALIVAGEHVIIGRKKQTGSSTRNQTAASSGNTKWTEQSEASPLRTAACLQAPTPATSPASLRAQTTRSLPQMWVAGGWTEGKPRDVSNQTISPFPKDEHTGTYAKAAADILKTAGTKEGFCLVVGNEDGRLAYEIAKQSNMQIYCVERDLAKVQQARQRFAKADLYGNRIVVHHADLDELPYSSYFANIVVSDTCLATGEMPIVAERIARHIKPLGGKLILPATNKKRSQNHHGKLRQRTRSQQTHH